MYNKSCPYGHGDLVLTHENESEKTYECNSPECKYSASEKTPLGWILVTAPIAAGIAAFMFGRHKKRPSPPRR